MTETRVPAGVPTGGQFATSVRAEADVALTDYDAIVAASDRAIADNSDSDEAIAARTTAAARGLAAYAKSLDPQVAQVSLDWGDQGGDYFDIRSVTLANGEVVEFWDGPDADAWPSEAWDVMAEYAQSMTNGYNDRLHGYTWSDALDVDPTGRDMRLDIDKTLALTAPPASSHNDDEASPLATALASHDNAISSMEAALADARERRHRLVLAQQIADANLPAGSTVNIMAWHDEANDDGSYDIDLGDAHDKDGNFLASLGGTGLAVPGGRIGEDRDTSDWDEFSADPDAPGLDIDVDKVHAWIASEGWKN